MIWLRRATVLGIALIATAIIFHFWGDLVGAMGTYFDQPVVSAQPSNEVTVGIVPDAAPKPVCDKTHRCR
ncbi:MAG TPA: hypothetical protein VIJ85_13755 [Rhizomicrobium sp.]